MNRRRSVVRRCAVRVSLLCASACTRTYYATMHKFGKEKRDILVSRIVDGKKDQDKAKEQLKTTMEAFQELTGFQGGDLEKTYNKLNKEYESAQSRADKVTGPGEIDRQGRQRSVQGVGREIDQMQDRELKSKSRAMLRDAQQRHEQYMAAMHATEKKMEPVLQAFHDQVTLPQAQPERARDQVLEGHGGAHRQPGPVADGGHRKVDEGSRRLRRQPVERHRGLSCKA